MAYRFENIGKNIMQIRKAKKISRAKLADKTGLMTKTIQRIENDGADCMISTLLKISEALKVDVKELFNPDTKTLTEI